MTRQGRIRELRAEVDEADRREDERARGIGWCGMISHTDEAKLLWFFGAGAAEIERSPSGAMLDRQWALRVEHVVDPEIAAARRAREPWEADPGSITARPTAEVRNPGKASPDEESAIKRSDVTSHLQRAVAVDSSARVVLSLYYGDDGCTWGRHQAGRGGALLHLTRTGCRLLAEEKSASSFELSTRERLQNLCTDPKRAPLVVKALAEAQAMLHTAARAWNATAEDPHPFVARAWNARTKES